MGKKIDDPARELYAKRREKLDLNREVEVFTMVAFVMLFPSIWIFMAPFLGSLFFLLGIIFSVVGIIRINSNPKKLKGLGFAIFSIIIYVLLIMINLLISVAAFSFY
jgi:flagellar biosynthesis protein FlhB